MEEFLCEFTGTCYRLYNLKNGKKRFLKEFIYGDEMFEYIRKNYDLVRIYLEVL